jgi:hypothetical protein
LAACQQVQGTVDKLPMKHVRTDDKRGHGVQAAVIVLLRRLWRGAKVDAADRGTLGQSARSVVVCDVL